MKSRYDWYYGECRARLAGRLGLSIAIFSVQTTGEHGETSLGESEFFVK